MPPVLMETNVPGYQCCRGKVRDIYNLGDGTIVIIATDRISAFDVVMANGIPGKGRALTEITLFWLEMFKREGLRNHLISAGLKDLPAPFQKPELEGRIMRCQKADVLPIECVVRGYITGSGWKNYKEKGEICGIELPRGLKECEKLPRGVFPIFTPATKAEKGHDENISFEEFCRLLGDDGLLARKLRYWSFRFYHQAHQYALEQGIIIADTKFEFGLLDKNLILIDEVLTPDSSRFWPADNYYPGSGQPSLDKQFVRDFLEGLCQDGQWQKEPPGPELPPEIVEKTAWIYQQICKRLTGK